MFDNLKSLPDDPILGLMALYRQDPSEQKVDLGAGVYQDENGTTPILACVKEAERRIYQEQTTKTYEGMAGNLRFNDAMEKLVFGEDHPALKDGRVGTVQTVGGSGGLRIMARTLGRATNDAGTIWYGQPTWPNHQPLLSDAGLALKPHDFYDLAGHRIDFDAMLASLEQVPGGDLVLLHGCCHNPTGADFTHEQWDALVEVFERRGLVPFIDMAYLGFAKGIEHDAYGARLCAERLPEVALVMSCSKNFGLYRDRVGTATIVAANADQARASASHLANVTRQTYSMPAAHGGAIVDQILNDPELTQGWMTELAEMRDRINGLRRSLTEALKARTGNDRFDFVADQTGMFSMLGLDKAQIDRLREEFHIYIVGSSRINVAGVNESTMDYLADSIAEVL
ncbi:MAG: amino acid aminotransferase [Xanthomonadales bacterium]|nr:amino acid aminotransferase [Xanthomonadales bacterium]